MYYVWQVQDNGSKYLCDICDNMEEALRSKMKLEKDLQLKRKCFEIQEV